MSTFALRSRSAGAAVAGHALVWPAFALASTCAYVLLRVFAFHNQAQTLGDTATYEAAEHIPTFDIDFLAGGRSFFVPLVWKAIEGHIVVGQLVISIAAWLLLALALAASLRPRLAKAIALWLVFGLSLCNPITQWDYALMSESISLSLLALVVAGTLFAVQRPFWLSLALVLLAGFAWAMTRDTNAYAALVAAPALAIALAVFHRRRNLLVAALAGTLLIFAVTYVDARHGGRDDGPIRDAVHLRLPHDNPAALVWMQAHGYTGLWGANTPSVYRSFLLHHPWWTATQVFRDRPTYATYSSPGRLHALYTPAVEDRRAPASHYRIPRLVQRVFWPSRPAWLGVELLVVLTLAVASGLVLQWRDPRLWVAVATLLAVYPQLLVAWHGSGQEIDRHALGAAVQLRIAALLVVALSVERLALVGFRPAPASARRAGRRRRRPAAA